MGTVKLFRDMKGYYLNVGSSKAIIEGKIKVLQSWQRAGCPSARRRCPEPNQDGVRDGDSTSSIAGAA